jgi:succinyl-CoA synthetase alpha subunit
MPHWAHADQVHNLSCAVVNGFSEFKPGKVGIMSRSGTLCYETVGATTKAGLGQSMVIGIGGDRTPGTTYVEALAALAEDPDTEGSPVWLQN